MAEHSLSRPAYNGPYGIAILIELREEKREPIDERKVNLCLAMVSQMGAATEIAKLHEHILDQFMETVLAMAESVEKSLRGRQAIPNGLQVLRLPSLKNGLVRRGAGKSSYHWFVT